MLCSVPGCAAKPDNHHRKRRGMGGGDGGEVIPLCRQHHTEAHQIGPVKFFQKYGIKTCSEERWLVLKTRYFESPSRTIKG